MTDVTGNRIDSYAATRPDKSSYRQVEQRLDRIDRRLDLTEARH